MAFQVLSILRSLAPLITDAGKIVVNMRSSSAAKTDDRILKLEQGVIRAGEVLKGLAEQLQIVAEEMRVQAEEQEQLQRKLRTALIVSIGALCVAMGALAVAIFR